jgi:hypothetical protein
MAIKKKKNLKPNVVSFRLTAHQYKVLVETYKNSPMSYVKSESSLARKIVCDFLAGRLVFKNPAHSKMDVDAHELAAVA